MADTFDGIRLRNLCKIFGPRAADYINAVRDGMSKTELNEKHGHVLGLRDINLDMPAGRIQVVMGLSGSGKSTLIRHINRLIEPTAGEIIVNGTDIVGLNSRALRAFRRDHMAMVFQKFALLPHHNVLENALYALAIQGRGRKESEEIARHWIGRVGLEGFERHYPSQLSGGMQQRVGLARALATDAPVLLMDEAYSALDPLIRMDMQSVLLDLQKEIRKTIIFITHDLDEALRLGDQIAILRDGAVVQQGTSQDIVLRPADDYIASFVKEVNRGRVIQVGAVMIPLSVSAAAQAGAARVSQTTSVEDAVRLLTQSGMSQLVITDEAGKPVGTAGLSELVGAMVPPAQSVAQASAQSSTGRSGNAR